MERKISRKPKLLGGLFILLILSVFIAMAGCTGPGESSGMALAQPEIIPDGFWLAKSTGGVRLFQKEYKNGTPDFVQIVSLNQGASVELLHGAVTAERQGKGAFGGNDARFQSQSLKKFWNAAKQMSDQVFCVTNGQFFYMPESPTRLTLPLKVDGMVVTDGFGADQFVGKRLMLELWQGHADIRELNGENLYNSDAPDILGGLSAEANRRAKDYTGRTFAGVQDRDRDGLFETMYVFNTRTARQVDADAVLKSFGAEKTIMLDGGGSTQLICEGENVITSERPIPQALAVIAGGQIIDTASMAAEEQGSQKEISVWDTAPDSGQEPVPDLQNIPPVEDGSQFEPSRMDGKVNVTSESVGFGNPILIPLLMIPFALIIFFVISRLRQSREEY